MSVLRYLCMTSLLPAGCPHTGGAPLRPVSALGLHSSRPCTNTLSWHPGARRRWSRAPHTPQPQESSAPLWGTGRAAVSPRDANRKTFSVSAAWQTAAPSFVAFPPAVASCPLCPSQLISPHLTAPRPCCPALPGHTRPPATTATPVLIPRAPLGCPGPSQSCWGLWGGTEGAMEVARYH